MDIDFRDSTDCEYENVLICWCFNVETFVFFTPLEMVLGTIATKINEAIYGVQFHSHFGFAT